MEHSFWADLLMALIGLTAGWILLDGASDFFFRIKNAVIMVLERIHNVDLRTLRHCPNCRNLMLDGENQCHYCGTDFKRENQAIANRKGLRRNRFIYSRVFKEGLTCVILVIGGATLAYFLPQILKGFINRRILLSVPLAWFLIVLLIRKRLFWYLRSSGDNKSKLLKDSRPPILYLRSFQDDLLAVYFRQSLWGTYEELLTSVLNDLGPVICLSHSSSMDRHPFGAVRINTTDENWRATVIKTISTAQLVIINVPGFSSEAVDWEIKTAIKHVNPERLVFVFFAQTVRFVEQLSYWSFKKKMDKLLPKPLPDPDTVDINTLCLYFESDWKPKLISGHNYPFKNTLWEFQSSLFLRFVLRPIIFQLGKMPGYWKYVRTRLLLIVLSIAVVWLFQITFKLFHANS